MDYIIIKIVLEQFLLSELIYPALVCKEWNEITQILKKGNQYKTPFHINNTPNLIYYSINTMYINICNKSFHKHIVNMNNISVLEYIKSKVDITSPDLFNLAISNGNLDIIKWLYKIGCHFDTTSFRTAIKKGNLDNIKWLFLKKPCSYSWNGLLDSAFKNGNLDNIKWLDSVFNIKPDRFMFTSNNLFTTLILNFALTYGNIDNIKWLMDNGSRCDHLSFNEAVKYGNLEIMKFLYEKNVVFNNKTLNVAIRHGSLDNIKWLILKNCPFNQDIINEALVYGNFDNIKYLISKGFELNLNNDLALNVDLDTMKWLYRRGYIFNHKTFSNAIQYNNFEILKWLFSIGYKYDNVYIGKPNTYTSKISENSDKPTPNTIDCFAYSAYKGNLQIMKLLKNNGYKYNTETFKYASMNGNLDNMKWLYEIGCELHNDVFSNAIDSKDSYIIIKWLIKINYQIKSNNITQNINIYKNLDIMKILFDKIKNIYEFHFFLAARVGVLTNMKWLYDMKCPFNFTTFDEAVINGNLQNMKWLLSKDCPFSNDTFNIALEEGIFENIKWLYENKCPYNIDHYMLKKKYKTKNNKHQIQLSYETINLLIHINSIDSIIEKEYLNNIIKDSINNGSFSTLISDL